MTPKERNFVMRLLLDVFRYMRRQCGWVVWPLELKSELAVKVSKLFQFSFWRLQCVTKNPLHVKFYIHIFSSILEAFPPPPSIQTMLIFLFLGLCRPKHLHDIEFGRPRDIRESLLDAFDQLVFNLHCYI